MSGQDEIESIARHMSEKARRLLALAVGDGWDGYTQDIRGVDASVSRAWQHNGLAEPYTGPEPQLPNTFRFTRLGLAVGHYLRATQANDTPHSASPS